MRTRSGRQTDVGRPRFPNRRRPKQYFRLLDLPGEIRYGILRVLLYRSEPLKFRDAEKLRNIYELRQATTSKRSFALYPEILGTCKQLYAEGAPILQTANIIGIDIWCSPYQSFSSCLGNKPIPGFHWDRIVSGSHQKLCQTSKTIHIFLHLQPLIGRMSDDSSFDFRMGTHEICETLARRTEISRSRLEIQWTEPARYEDDNDIGENILDGFALLRPKEAVIEGFSKEYAAKIQGAMLSKNVPENLFAMRQALINYLEPMYFDCYYEVPGWWDVEGALWKCDHYAFKRARNAIVRSVEDERAELRRKLYEHEVGGEDHQNK